MMRPHCGVWLYLWCICCRISQSESIHPPTWHWRSTVEHLKMKPGANYVVTKIKEKNNCQTTIDNPKCVQSLFKAQMAVAFLPRSRSGPTQDLRLPSLSGELTCSRSLLGNNWRCSCRVSSHNLIGLYLQSVCQSQDCRPECGWTSRPTEWSLPRGGRRCFKIDLCWCLLHFESVIPWKKKCLCESYTSCKLSKRQFNW